MTDTEKLVERLEFWSKHQYRVVDSPWGTSPNGDLRLAASELTRLRQRVEELEGALGNGGFSKAPGEE
jgi:hypothetical protein